VYILKALYLSVFKPRALVDNRKAYDFVLHSGWALIVLRWLYYSILFQFRDYHGRWAPFVPPPFGLDRDPYTALHRTLALPFGLVLMLTLSLSLAASLRISKNSIPLIAMLNILGATFVLPFVVAQPMDR
jgi:hypothetical protein